MILREECVHQFRNSGISSSQITKSYSFEYVDLDEIWSNDLFRDIDGGAEDYEDKIKDFSTQNSVNVSETRSVERKGDGAGYLGEVVNGPLYYDIHYAYYKKPELANYDRAILNIQTQNIQMSLNKSAYSKKHAILGKNLEEED